MSHLPDESSQFISVTIGAGLLRNYVPASSK